MKAVTIIGMGDDGCVGLSSKAAGAISRAQVLAGGQRHLDFFPQFEGRRIIFKGEIIRSVQEIAELCADHTVCILASGDPLFYGIGGLIGKKIGIEHVDIIPAPSSVQLAFSRIGIKWDDAEIISLHGRSIQGFIGRLQRVAKVACLTDAINSPQAIARYLREFEEVSWKAYVCENLGGQGERVREFSIPQLCEVDGISDLNVLLLLRNTEGWRRPQTLANLDEDEYAKRMPKNGLITKREVRVLSLAALQLRPDSIVWDIGAGSGSVSIESAKLAYEGEVYAVEIDSECAEYCRQNVRTHRVDNVRVIEERAPAALLKLKDPDAIFVGGSKGSMAEIIQVCLGRLKPKGRLVVNAITLDNVAEAYQAFRAQGMVPELSVLNISRGQKLAHYLRYEALNPIHIFSVTKDEETA
ncbi:MAG: precorrin-6y C5,15-methyltransferase (decarboxylating) subunit CbiE [Bdellovibrionia bacterium]